MINPIQPRTVTAALALALAAAVALTGCARRDVVFGGQSGDGDGSVSSGPAVDSPGMTGGGVSCTATDLFGLEPSPGGPAPVPLATDFVPVAATRCLMRNELVPGDGEWLFRLEQRADGDLSALVTGLRRPDISATEGMACNAIGYLPIIITLVDAAGATTVPALPREACGGPQREAVEALEALPWKTTNETKLRQTRTPLETDSQCPGSYKPVVALMAADGGGRPGVTGPVFARTPTSVRVCRYEIDRSLPSVNVNGVDFGTGVLKSASTVDGTALAQVLAALDTAPPADGTCTEPQAAFAVVDPVGEGGGFLAVELGGCYRFTAGDGGVRQANAAVAALLTN